MRKYLSILLSYVLTFVLCLTIYTIYEDFGGPLRVQLIAATFAIITLFFALCALTDRHHFIGGIILGVFFMASVYLFSYLALGTRNGIAFLEWLLTKGYEVEDSTQYFWMACVFFTTFFSITVYYFSNVLYRMFFLTLLSLVPCVVYLKVMAEMDNIFLVIIAVCNLSIYIANRKQNSSKEVDKFFANTLIASGAFMLLLFFITSAIPKNAETPFYDDFEDAFMGGDTSSPVSESFSELSSFSNDAGGFLGLSFGSSNRKLFHIVYSGSGGNPPYLKRQNFDYYDFKKDKWYSDTSYQGVAMEPEKYTETMRDLNLPSLQQAILAAEYHEPGFIKKYGLEGLNEINLPKATLDSMHITALNFGAIFYLNAPQSLSVTAMRDDKEPYYATKHGAFFSSSTSHPTDFSYDVRLYDDANWRLLWLKNGGSNITMEDTEKCLREMVDIFTEKDDEHLQIAKVFLDQLEYAKQYHEDCEENTEQIPQEIKDLAELITKDLTYDYEKAQALTDFFYMNGFVYDLEYNPLDDSPENFLFNTKRGSCSDYASAFTLMARSVGLTVRYAEGYVLERGDNFRSFVIKSRDAHAYPEVYLPNVGWVLYEPTVARMESMEGHFSLENLISNLQMDYGLMAVILVFAVIGAVIIALLRLFLPFVLEVIFRIRLFTVPREKALLMTYNRIAKKASAKAVPDAYSQTPYELAQALKPMGCEMSDLSSWAEQLLYDESYEPKFEKQRIMKIYHSVSMGLFKFKHMKRNAKSRGKKH